MVAINNHQNYSINHNYCALLIKVIVRAKFLGEACGDPF